MAEFAVEQLATRLRISSISAMSLVADVLDLAHRHPVLWRRARAGACPTWTARSIAHDCSSLPVEAAAWVDAQIGHLAGRCTKRKLESTLAYAIAKWDPAKTRKAEEQARDARHLDLELPGQNCRPTTVATAAIRGQLSPTDAVKFDALVSAKAAQLAEQGDTSSVDIRRAKALGVIADQLMTGELDLTAEEQGSGVGFVARELAPQPPRRRSSLPATLALLAEWLEDTDLPHPAGPRPEPQRRRGSA